MRPSGPHPVRRGLPGSSVEQVRNCVEVVPEQARVHVEQFRATFDWHPSEATVLLAAAARGVRGRVEIRDSGLSVALTDRSSATFRLGLADVIDVNKLARALVSTSSLDEAGEIAREVCGISEIDYERTKADRINAVASPTALTDVDHLIAYVGA